MRARLLRSVAVLAGLFATGTAGYQVIEWPGWWPAFYMTVITLTTVGYGEVFELSRAGEVFTSMLLLGGFGVFLYVVTDLGRSILEREFAEGFGQTRRLRMIERMSGHQIVAGWGRMGQAVVSELRRAGHKVVVIEQDEGRVRELRESGQPFVAADATSEPALRAAGVDRAYGLVTCLPDDAQNVYTVLTARSLNPDLQIVARASAAGAETRIIRAGANRVVNPYHLGGTRLAHLLVKPTVVELLEISVAPGAEDMRLDQIVVPAESALVGRTIAEADPRRRWGVAVVAIRRGASLVPNPEPDSRFAAGDVLVILGRRHQVEEFEGAVLTATSPAEHRS